MIDTVLAMLPAEHQRRFRGFLAAPVEPVATLERELDEYVALLHHMAKRIPVIDGTQVQKLEVSFRALLHHPPATEEVSALTNAAVRYFLRKEQDHDDTTAVITFDDDIAVLNAVSRSIDRPDLAIAPRQGSG